MKTKPTEALRLLSEIKLNPIHEIPRHRADIIARIAFKEGQSSPKIKQLEWDFYGLYYEVKTAVGHYMILQGDEQYFENHNTCTLTLNGSLMANFDSADEAKVAAQADFEERVKECLITE